MDFDFSPGQLAFVDEVERFLDENDDPEVFDVTRENMAQIVDTPKRRELMRKMAEGPETRVPWVGEHTDEVLRRELGLGDDDLAELVAAGVIACQ